MLAIAIYYVKALLQSRDSIYEVLDCRMTWLVAAAGGKVLYL